MSGRVLEVLAAGPCVTVQDRGRPGLQRYGVAEGGALDRHALAAGAALLGNGDDAAALELGGQGGRFRVHAAAARFALAGAPMPAAKVEASGHREILRWGSSGLLQPGEELEIGVAAGGFAGYLHLGGGIATKPELGARAVHLRAGIGGARLEAGHRLPLGEDAGEARRFALPEPGYLARREIRIVWGPQAEVFDAETRQRFLESSYKVSGRRDRMGARLEGPSFHAEGQLTGLSDAVSLGDVQIPGDGAPVVLLADRQPTGGYPRIATVITADLAAFAQLPTGGAFRFRLVAEEEALAALRSWRAELASLPGKVRPLVREPHEIRDLLAYNLIDGVVAGDPQEDGKTR